jgi:hypothetical protein
MENSCGQLSAMRWRQPVMGSLQQLRHHCLLQSELFSSRFSTETSLLDYAHGDLSFVDIVFLQKMPLFILLSAPQFLAW